MINVKNALIGFIFPEVVLLSDGTKYPVSWLNNADTNCRICGGYGGTAKGHGKWVRCPNCAEDFKMQQLEFNF